MCRIVLGYIIAGHIRCDVVQQLGEICNFEELVQRDELQSHGSRWGLLGRSGLLGRLPPATDPISASWAWLGIDNSLLEEISYRAVSYQISYNATIYGRPRKQFVTFAIIAIIWHNIKWSCRSNVMSCYD